MASSVATWAQATAWAVLLVVSFMYDGRYTGFRALTYDSLRMWTSLRGTWFCRSIGVRPLRHRCHNEEEGYFGRLHIASRSSHCTCILRRDPGAKLALVSRPHVRDPQESVSDRVAESALHSHLAPERRACTALDGVVIAPDSFVESDREVDSCPAPQSRDLSAIAQDNLAGSVSCSLEP